MSTTTDILYGSDDSLPETIYVVTKKLGVHPREQIALADEIAAKNWLADKVATDRAMGEFEWKQYDKQVVESVESGDVYGHVQEIPTL